MVKKRKICEQFIEIAKKWTFKESKQTMKETYRRMNETRGKRKVKIPSQDECVPLR